MKVAILAIAILIASSLAAFPPQEDGRGPDGHFHDPETGEVQPDHCDNGFANTHPCHCQKTKSCNVKEHDKTCQVYCRKDACRCVADCS